MLKDILRLGLILFAISAIATALLAWVNSVTLPRINIQKEKDAELTRQQLMPSAKTFEEKIAAADTNLVYYIAKDDKNEILGYTIVAQGRGYSSTVKTMIALDREFKIMDLKVFEQAETPGLGTHCQDKDFPAKFKGREAEGLMVDKDGGQVQSITGATITTRAITNSVRDTILKVKADIAGKDEAGKQ